MFMYKKKKQCYNFNLLENVELMPKNMYYSRICMHIWQNEKWKTRLSNL